MSDSISKLLALSTERLAPNLDLTESGGRLEQLVNQVFSINNGFYAFESALLVRPLSWPGAPLGVVEWNSPSSWKSRFNCDLSVDIFFAEDIFGEQFSLRCDGVFKFNPETAEPIPFAVNLEDWARRILADYDLHTGHQIAQDWQEMNGPLRKGHRLAPKVPFVVGGDYAISNLVSVAERDLMEFRSQLANQVSDLPDGACIKFDVVQ